MYFRFAKPEDAELLAPLNAQLIRDEGHNNPMTVVQLVERMSGWLRGGKSGNTDLCRRCFAKLAQTGFVQCY